MADERTISGRALVVAGLAVVVVVVLVSVVAGPSLRDAVLQEQSPRTLREPIAAGTHEGRTWEAVGRFDGHANCVELRYSGAVLDRACDRGAGSRVTQLPGGGPSVAYGVADDTWARVRLDLEDGREVVAEVRAGELGFPVGFWAAQLPAGVRLENTARAD